MQTGGIETLILRMTDWLVKNEYNVDILLLYKRGELLSKINKKANVISLGSFPELRLWYNSVNRKYSKNYNVIFSFSPLTTWISIVIAQRMKCQPIVLNGVYHLYDYKLFANNYQRSVFSNILPDRCKIFMTPLVKVEHEGILGRQMNQSLIWPIPIDCSKYESIVRNPKRHKIVSIGRLEGFKTYNTWMLDLVKKLVDRNMDVVYNIYGDGHMVTDITKKIAELKMQNNIFLCGTIDYSKIAQVLSDAFVFVGMGTSAIEAGLCKVPAIVAIAYENSPITHGYIHTLPNYNCGEFIDDYPSYDVYEQIDKLFNSSVEEYDILSNESHEVLKRTYDINYLMNSLLKEIESIQAENITCSKLKIPHYYIFSQTIIHLVDKVKSLFKMFLIKCRLSFFSLT